ncbi:MAG: hypothetical protein Ct9H300mP28_20900 [Pseudomonadota bacterium]|nr:MAG: hypothetical protein Ct9H300mP28_20900 [Pseudomonadota bacterium]
MNFFIYKVMKLHYVGITYSHLLTEPRWSCRHKARPDLILISLPFLPFFEYPLFCSIKYWCRHMNAGLVFFYKPQKCFIVHKTKMFLGHGATYTFLKKTLIWSAGLLNPKTPLILIPKPFATRPR